MSQALPVNYRMLTPLIRLKIDTKQKICYKINENLQIIVNDPTIFPGWNNVAVQGKQSIELLPGIASVSFNYNPLLFAFFPYVENYPDHATQVLDIFLKALALFKTTKDTKLKDGPRIVQTLSQTPDILTLNLRGADDWGESHAKPYELTTVELKEFADFYNEFADKISKFDNKKFLLALEFYTKCSRTEDIIEKFIFLSLAFEFLFSNENDELSYRFSNRISLLLGENFEERTYISKVVKNVIYPQRSSIVHGGSVEKPDENVLTYFNELIRVSILRFMSLFYEGYQDPIKILDSHLLKQNNTDYSNLQQKAKNHFSNVNQLKFIFIKAK